MPLPPLSGALWTIWFVAAIIYGVSIGSFLNVVIYRLPRGQSVSSPTWSYCPNCEHRLSGMDLAPLFSFLALGRKCRYCRKPISWRYFGVEFLTGVLFALVFLHDGPGIDAIFDALFVSILVPIFFIDLEQFFIPDELSILGLTVGLAHSAYGIFRHKPGMWSHIGSLPALIPASIVSAVICAFLFHLISFFGLLYYASANKERSKPIGASAGAFWLGILDDYAYLWLKFLGFGLWLPAAKRFIASRESTEAVSVDSSMDPGLVKSRDEIAAEIEDEEDQTGMGQGDAKLAGMIGANLLLKLSLISFFLAVLAGTIIGVGLIIARGRNGRTAIPFGPFMALGALAALLFGSTLWGWYYHYAFPAPSAPPAIYSSTAR